MVKILCFRCRAWVPCLIGTKISQGMLRVATKKKKAGREEKGNYFQKVEIVIYLLKSERNSNIYTSTGNEV